MIYGLLGLASYSCRLQEAYPEYVVPKSIAATNSFLLLSYNKKISVNLFCSYKLKEEDILKKDREQLDK